MKFRPKEDADVSNFFFTKRDAKGKYVRSRSKRKFIFERDGFKCLACDSTDNLTIDHVVPTSKGGTNELNNLQTLCEICNTNKGNRIRDYRNLSNDMDWKHRGDHSVCGDFKIYENVYWGSNRTTKDYTLYKKSDAIFTGTFSQCKIEAEKE